MDTVRAGVVSGPRAVLYGSLGISVTLVVAAVVTWWCGLDRIFTGILLGSIAGATLLVLLFHRDAVVLADRAIYRRTPWTESSIDWERVVAGRFTLDEDARWTLALDLDAGAEPHHELVLLTIPPVVRPVADAYDHRKREQLLRIRNILRYKRIPVVVLPAIGTALHRHWKLAPPTR